MENVPTNVPLAKVLRLEARTEFDSFYPLEVVARPEEVQAMLDRRAAAPSRSDMPQPDAEGETSRSGRSAVAAGEGARAPFRIFPEDRRFPIRMTDDLPLRWVKSAPTNVFRGEAQRNEFYVFQIGVWAARTNLAGLDLEFSGKIASWRRCFNTGGTNWVGQPFHITLAVPQSHAQALWFGVDVPPDAKPGEHRATVTVRPTNAPPSSVELVLTVLPTELADRGDGDLWRLARLRWLASTMGGEAPSIAGGLTALGHSLELDRRTLRVAGCEVHLGWRCLPDSIRYGTEELLAGPIAANGWPPNGQPRGLTYAMSEPSRSTASVSWSRNWHLESGRVRFRGTREADGPLRFRFSVFPASISRMSGGVLVQIPLRSEVATYFMGLGLRACPTPTNFTWHWTGPYNSFWIGGAQAGLHVKLLGSTYEGPMQNLYQPKPPPSWFNEGKGGVRISYRPPGDAASGSGDAPRSASSTSAPLPRHRSSQPLLGRPPPQISRG